MRALSSSPLLQKRVENVFTWCNQKLAAPDPMSKLIQNKIKNTRITLITSFDKLEKVQLEPTI